jgi:hypothetical protein
MHRIQRPPSKGDLSVVGFQPRSRVALAWPMTEPSEVAVRDRGVVNAVVSRGGAVAPHIWPVLRFACHRHGNRMLAPEGTIPMRRLTLETMARFRTLQHFLQKSPYGSAVPPRAGGAAGLGGAVLSSAATAMPSADLRGARRRAVCRATHRACRSHRPVGPPHLCAAPGAARRGG